MARKFSDYWLENLDSSVGDFGMDIREWLKIVESGKRNADCGWNSFSVK